MLLSCIIASIFILQEHNYCSSSILERIVNWFGLALGFGVLLSTGDIWLSASGVWFSAVDVWSGAGRGLA